MVRYGFLIRTKIDNGEFETPPPGEDGYQPDPEEERSRREWSAMFIIVMGAFLLVKSSIEFIRLKRMQALANSTPFPL